MKFGLNDNTIALIEKVFESNSKIDKVMIFGSRAKGNFKPGSDIDLAVQGRDITFDDILSLSSKLDDLNLPYEIDLINYSTVKDEDVIEHIDRVGIVFYERWKEHRLKDVTIKIGSGATPTGGGNNYKAKGISLIRSQNILDLAFSYDGLAFIDDEQANGLKNVIVKENDVLLNITGDSVARVCKVPKEVLPARVNQHVSITRADNKTITADFLLYNLFSLKDHLLSISEIGGTRNALTKTMIENVVVDTPPIVEQKEISSTLRSLDDKIDLLQRQNKTLEQLAETLFRQWFVEEVSEDWEVKTVADVADFYNGKSRPNETGTIPIYGGNGILGYTNTSNYSGKSIIVGRVGAYCGSLYFENKEIWVSDNALLVKTKNENLTHYLFYLLKSLELNTMAEGSSHPLLTQTLLKSIELDLPPINKLESFYYYAGQWREKIEKNNNQVITLTRLRDELLPKLMSGEVRVKT